MSKALEAAPLRDKLAKAIHPDAFGVLGAIRPDAIAVAYDAADRVLSVLAHLAEDEAVVERLSDVIADAMNMNRAGRLEHEAALAALRSLAGKE